MADAEIMTSNYHATLEHGELPFEINLQELTHHGTSTGPVSLLSPFHTAHRSYSMHMYIDLHVHVSASTAVL